jgi:hypothetical protein
VNGARSFLRRSENISWKHFHFLAALFLLLFVSFLVFATHAATSDGDLKRHGEKFVTVFESKNASALLDLFSEQGTSFISGTYALPKASYSPAEIRKEFAARTAVYCVFFDTACIRDADSKERARQKARPIRVPLRSVSDLLATVQQKRFVTYSASAMNGEVTLLLSARTPDTARLGEDALNFLLPPRKWPMEAQESRIAMTKKSEYLA